MQFASMGYYETPPRHSHRSPAELAEDEIIAALRGVGYPPRERATTWLQVRSTQPLSRSLRKDEFRRNDQDRTND